MPKKSKKKNSKETYNKKIPKETPKKIKELDSKNHVFTPKETYYIKNYKEKYLQFPTTSEIQAKINNPKDDYLYLYGSYNRISALMIFGYYLNLDIVDTICTTFKLKDLSDNSEVIYSFGYFEYDSKHPPPYSVKPPNTNYLYRYFNTGGSFLSKDGEYRSGLISYISIKKIKNTPILKNIFQDIFLYIQKNLTKRGIIILKEYFYPKESKKLNEFELEYYSYTLQYELFSITWLNSMLNLYLNINENHLNEKFKKIMYKHKKEDLEFLNELIKTYTIEEIYKLRYLTNNIFTSYNNIDKKNVSVKLGQKIIPLSIAESQNPFSINFKPWREYLITSHLSNYIVNNIAPGFFLTNSWFYIKNSRKGLFDNEIQYEKMERSELAIQITELLNKAKLFTQENISKKTLKLTNKRLNTYISNKFKELSQYIQTPIDFAKEDIIMSNVALCIISEYVGRTLWDVMLLSKSSTYYNNLIGQPFTLSGSHLFAKYMFEMCYNLYCMNSISGIIHGDLHLNNITLNPLTYQNEKNINNVQNPNVLYVLGDEKNQYIFPTVGYYTCLIDFSRSIILPEKVQLLNLSSIPKTFKIFDNIQYFQKDQVDRLLSLYIRHTTDSEANKDDLRILFKNKFEAVFKLLTTIDVYGITQKLLHMFLLNEKNVVKPHKNCIDLLEKINKYSQTYLTVEMNKLITDANYEKTILEMEYPIFTIIKNCFYEYSVINAEIGNIVDIYNINNELKFSLDKLELYPDRIKNDTISYIKYSKSSRNIFEKQKQENMKTISYIATRQKQKHL